ncbi:MAG: hypothetical protein HOH98_04750 [Flavobacteriaceae bacterium]|nr:hypothetical protein [Flavobacteriaceae bacterium]
MNLYFNTKLVGSTIHENSSQTFYPVVNPKDYYMNNDTLPFEILKSVLISYSKLQFKKCVFNIELINTDDNSEIKNLIEENFNNTQVFISFKRPYDKNTWMEDITKHFGNNLDQPILLAMNHDHQFIDYQDNTFINILNKIFPSNENNFKKVFFYSHIPELISAAENRIFIQNKKYVEVEKSLYSIKGLNHQVDSVTIMTARTFHYIISQIIIDIEYFGRIDWKNLFFKKLNINGFFYAREFFRHFEGYHHVSGIRINKDLSLNSSSKKVNLEFYYEKWLNLSIFLLRDGLKNFSLNKKKHLIKLVEKSIQIFNDSYLTEDANYNIISKDECEELKYSLRSKIYYNLNMIYSEIKIDNELKGNNILKTFYNTRIKYFTIIRLIKKLIKLK